MNKMLWLISISLTSLATHAQQRLTPERLWQLGRVSGIGITRNQQSVVYAVSTPDITDNKSRRSLYLLPLTGGTPVPISNSDSLLANDKISPDGKFLLMHKEVKMDKTAGAELYPDLPKSNVQIFHSLDYRHWDSWRDGKYNHVFIAPIADGQPGEAKDIMAGEHYDCPMRPFGGPEDYTWSPDGKTVVYTSLKKTGTAYAVSTNTDLYAYDPEKGTTSNLTGSNKGYDKNPSFNHNGILAWLQMRRDGYESDKQDLVVSDGKTTVNLTGYRNDIHVESYRWSVDGQSLFFISPIDGTLQLFNVGYSAQAKSKPAVRQLTKGDFDVNDIVGQSGNTLVVSRADMNHAAELYTLDLATDRLTQLTHVNDEAWRQFPACKTERRYVTTTDHKRMLVWVIYPPGFDAAKKYPTLLYCQGGPQAPLTQSYSFRWNFQLMASQGYIVVAPCRRGMPGFGTLWNEQVSRDWGGQVIRDYLSAIDAVSKEPFVDKNRRGCVGASFGGYSVFALAGLHNGRFKTFIAHDGIFDFRSFYGTTEEMFFANWEMGGPYWEHKNAVAQRSFSQSPSNFVDRWNTPIMIVQGGRDYRVPFEQGQQAFQAAQLKGIKSKFLYFPEENHWVLKAQDALVWQHEFFNWLEETL